MNRFESDLGALADPAAADYLTDVALAGFSAAEALAFLRRMRLIRSVEEQIARWVETGRARCPCHLGIGQEAVAVGIAHALRRTDRLFGNHRSHAHYLAVGAGVYELLAEVLGRDTGCSRGMGGSMHLYAAGQGFLGSVPIVAGTIPIAVGAALAAKMDGGSDIAAAYFGDGACEEGVLHEALNLARVYEVPALFVCENNLFSSHLDINLRQPSDRMARFAEAHRVRTAVIDGNDVTGVARVASELIGWMRETRMPAFLELVTYRWRGHVGPKEDVDVGVRRRPEDLVAWKRRDPVARLERALLAAGHADAATLTALAADVTSEVEQAAVRAEAAPFPADAALLDRVYSGAGA